VFQDYDKDGDNALRLNEVADLFIKLNNMATALPPTAQVASQQGQYIGNMLTRLSKETTPVEQIDDVDDAAYYPPFKYRHLGSLAYVGNSAVFDYYGFSVVGGLAGMYAWRSIYWSEQASIRSRFMLMLDWVKRGLFGRDISKVSATAAVQYRRLTWCSSRIGVIND
jgi:NADH dehydrogenase